MNVRRILFLAHRWLGISFVIFVLIWLVSGIVMMYVGYPKLTHEERIAHGAPLSTTACCRGIGRALEQLATNASEVAVLRMFDHGQPTLMAVLADKSIHVFDGNTGRQFSHIEPDTARRNAEKFLNGARISSVERVIEDAWTHTKSLDPYRPFYRVDAVGGEIAHVYVSVLTGEVVRDVTRAEKTWIWAGAWVHWLYMFRGGVLDFWWSDLLIWLSLGALLLACSGLVVGILRWRTKGYKNGRNSPYSDRYQRIHHVFGLVVGPFLITWLLSGFFSMNPNRIFDSRSQAKMVQSIPSNDLRQVPDAANALRCMQSVGFVPVELEWSKMLSAIHILGVSNDGRNFVYRADDLTFGRECAEPRHYSEDELLGIARLTFPLFQPVQVRQQTDYDWHYYPRGAHTMHGHYARPLPVLVVSFDDPESTSLYLDYQTGRILLRTDDRQKSMRTLFKFLHSFDWYPLLSSRPAWDVALILTSIGGMFVAATALVLALRRLRRTGR